MRGCLPVSSVVVQQKSLGPGHGGHTTVKGLSGSLACGDVPTLVPAVCAPWCMPPTQSADRELCAAGSGHHASPRLEQGKSYPCLARHSGQILPGSLQHPSQPCPGTAMRQLLKAILGKDGSGREGVVSRLPGWAASPLPASAAGRQTLSLSRLRRGGRTAVRGLWLSAAHDSAPGLPDCGGHLPTPPSLCWAAGGCSDRRCELLTGDCGAPDAAPGVAGASFPAAKNASTPAA